MGPYQLHRNQPLDKVEPAQARGWGVGWQQELLIKGGLAIGAFITKNIKIDEFNTKFDYQKLSACEK